MKYILSFLLIILVAASYSQKTDGDLTLKNDLIVDLQKPENSGGQINIIQANALHYLVNRNVKLNEKIASFPGYRLEILSASGYGARDKANEVRRAFSLQHEDMPAYIVWDNINFRVRIGDFRNRNEARKAMWILRNDYPGAFIVKDLIEHPQLEKSEVTSDQP